MVFKWVCKNSEFGAMRRGHRIYSANIQDYSDSIVYLNGIGTYFRPAFYVVLSKPKTPGLSSYDEPSPGVMRHL